METVNTTLPYDLKKPIVDNSQSAVCEMVVVVWTTYIDNIIWFMLFGKQQTVQHNFIHASKPLCIHIINSISLIVAKSMFGKKSADKE